VAVLAASALVTDRLDAVAGGWTWQAATLAGIEGPAAVAFSLWVVTWFRYRWNHSGPLTRWAGPGSYAAYVLHPPVLVLASMVTRPLPLPPEGKFVLVAPSVWWRHCPGDGADPAHVERLILIADARRVEFMDGAVLRHGLQLTLRQGRNPAQSASAEPSSATSCRLAAQHRRRRRSRHQGPDGRGDVAALPVGLSRLPAAQRALHPARPRRHGPVGCCVGRQRSSDGARERLGHRLGQLLEVIAEPVLDPRRLPRPPPPAPPWG
jgi:hypothetical protein